MEYWDSLDPSVCATLNISPTRNRSGLICVLRKAQQEGGTELFKLPCKLRAQEPSAVYMAQTHQLCAGSQAPEVPAISWHLYLPLDTCLWKN